MRLNLELLNRSYVKEDISHPWVGWSPLVKRVVLLLYRAIRPLSGFLFFTNCCNYDLELFYRPVRILLHFRSVNLHLKFASLSFHCDEQCF